MEVAGSPQQQTPLQCNYVNEWLLHISQDQVPRECSKWEKGSSVANEHVIFFYCETHRGFGILKTPFRASPSLPSTHKNLPQQNPQKTKKTINDPAPLNSVSVCLCRKERRRLRSIVRAITSLEIKQPQMNWCHEESSSMLKRPIKWCTAHCETGSNS